MAKKKPTRPKRLVCRRHFCGWKWESANGVIYQGTDHENRKPKRGLVGYPYGPGRWVRVQYAKV